MVGTTSARRDIALRVFALLAAVTLLLLPVALPIASASPDYPPVFYKISADRYSARVGQNIAFTAQTFQKGSAVTFSVGAADATVTSGSTHANADGIARRSLTFTVAGTNTVSVSGTSDKGAPLNLSTTVVVTNASGDNGGDGTGGGNNGGGNNASGDNGSNSNSAPQAEESSGVPFFGGGLPRTGTDVALTVLVGLALVGGGAGLVMLGRNRRNSH